jgi:protein TonB
MALRALLFSADSSATAVLCEILTDLHIEAEICTELLVATERLTRESYGAILVDWEQESEAVQLLKSAREKKAGQALNLVLVRDDKDVGRALQQGANAVIKKPVDPRQAEETLSTARDLILSRRADQKEKEDRIAAVLEASAAEDLLEKGAQGEKTGFLEQTAPRSAFEVAAHAAESEPLDGGVAGWQPALSPREAEAHHEPATPRPPETKRWDQAKPPVKIEEPSPRPVASSPSLADSTSVSSPLPEEPEEAAEEASHPKPHSQRLGFVLVICILIAGVVYVWAPGDSYGDRLTSIWHLLPFARETKSAPSSAAKTPEKSEAEGSATKAEEPTPDNAQLTTTDVDPSKIQIIESKTIPKSGAQVPPVYAPPPGSDQALALARAQALAQTDTPGGAAPQTNDASPLATALQGEPAVDVPSQSPKPAVVPVARPRPSVPLTAAENEAPMGEGKNGVIIPDSLKNTPSQTPANSFQTTVVPEEISRNLIASKVDPEYPPQALQQRLDGTVVLQVWVSKDGSVQDLKLVKGYILLGRSAVDAIRQWRFKPYAPNGNPMEFQTSVTVNFKAPR